MWACHICLSLCLNDVSECELHIGACICAIMIVSLWLCLHQIKLMYTVYINKIWWNKCGSVCGVAALHYVGHLKVFQWVNIQKSVIALVKTETKVWIKYKYMNKGTTSSSKIINPLFWKNINEFLYVTVHALSVLQVMAGQDKQLQKTYCTSAQQQADRETLNVTMAAAAFRRTFKAAAINMITEQITWLKHHADCSFSSHLSNSINGFAMIFYSTLSFFNKRKPA